MCGNIGVFQKILDLGADVNSQDNERIVPFHHAARYCNINMVRQMIDYEAHTGSVDKYGRTAIRHLAAGDETGSTSEELEIHLRFDLH